MNEAPRLISISDAAARLGYKDTNTLRILARDSKIPGAFKIGKTWALPLAWVEQKEKEEKESVPQGKGWRRGKTS